MNLAEALKAAIGYEARIRDLYRDAALAVDDEVGKRVLRVLQAQEQGHLDYLRDRLRGLGYWYDFSEFDLEAG